MPGVTMLACLSDRNRFAHCAVLHYCPAGLHGACCLLGAALLHVLVLLNTIVYPNIFSVLFYFHL